ncbi:class I SAM-dependent methyltransferase [Streptomyces triculaminicus]|uniref:class I SAM-dependent methyltransferase n=1 Tax=Streptomyces triculaminicus TaxID=2816232 RepID=UPI0037B8FEE6
MTTISSTTKHVVAHASEPDSAAHIDLVAITHTVSEVLRATPVGAVPDSMAIAAAIELLTGHIQLLLPIAESSHRRTRPQGSSADRGICVDALNFAPDPRAAFEELRRLLRPGARAVFTSADRRPASSRPWNRVGLELEAEDERPHVPGMWRRLYRLWTDHEADLRSELGDAQADRMLDEARRRAPEMAYRRFSIVTVRHLT